MRDESGRNLLLFFSIRVNIGFYLWIVLKHRVVLKNRCSLACLLAATWETSRDQLDRSIVISLSAEFDSTKIFFFGFEELKKIFKNAYSARSFVRSFVRLLARSILISSRVELTFWLIGSTSQPATQPVSKTTTIFQEIKKDKENVQEFSLSSSFSARTWPGLVNSPAYLVELTTKTCRDMQAIKASPVLLLKNKHWLEIPDWPHFAGWLAGWLVRNERRNETTQLSSGLFLGLSKSTWNW